MKKRKQDLIKRTSLGAGVIIGLIIILNLGFVPYFAQFGAMIHDRAVAYDTRDAYIQQIKNEPTLQCPIKLPSTYLVGTQENMDLFQDPAHAVNAGVMRYYRLPCQVVGQ